MAERSKRFQSAVLLFAVVLLIFLFTAIALSFLPQDLSDLEGRNEDSTASAPQRDIEQVLKNAAEQGIQATLTEKEVNQWLAHRLSGTQEGMLQNTVSYKGTWVRIKDGWVEFIFEREAFNRPHTIAMSVEIEQLIEENNQMSSDITWKNGRLGQMPVPQGYLLLVMSSYEELATAMAKEVQSLKSMLRGKAVIEFAEGKVTFSPRSANADATLKGF